MEDIFFEAFEGMGRLGPGSDASTRKAADLFGRKNEALTILDAGCGNGIQTLVLAEAFPDARITALDNYAPFLENLKREAEKRGVARRLTTVCASLEELPFPEASFDLIWSEGAIYVIGFERGIREWKGLLKPGGALVCSEVCWLTSSPTPEIAAFWQKEYPEIGTVGEKLKAAENAGYRSHRYFHQPSSDWEGYYGEVQKNLDRMRVVHAGNPDAREIIGELQEEIDLFGRYGDQYGYVFFGLFA